MHRYPRLAPLTLLLFAVALLARAAVPAGWMPVSGSDGLRIALCNGQGAVLLLDSGHGQQNHGGHHDDHQPSAEGACPFAMLAQPFDLADDNVPTLPPAFRTAQTGPALVAARLVAWRSLRPPARGPPVFA